MQFDILYKPAYTLLEIKLEAGERIEAESGAMVYMSPGIEIATKTKGGVFGALKRGILGGELFCPPGCRGSGYPVLIVRGGSVPRLIANITSYEKSISS